MRQTSFTLFSKQLTGSCTNSMQDGVTERVVINHGKEIILEISKRK